MPRENKNTVVVATAPDGEIIAFGPMRRWTDAAPLVKAITAQPGWSAVIPIFGSKDMWPSTLEAKSGRPSVTKGSNELPANPGIGYTEAK